MIPAVVTISQSNADIYHIFELLTIASATLFSLFLFGFVSLSRVVSNRVLSISSIIAGSTVLFYICVFVAAIILPKLANSVLLATKGGQIIESVALSIGGISLCNQPYDLKGYGIAAGCFELLFGVISLVQPDAASIEFISQALFMISGVIFQAYALRTKT